MQYTQTTHTHTNTHTFYEGRYMIVDTTSSTAHTHTHIQTHKHTTHTYTHILDNNKKYTHKLHIHTCILNYMHAFAIMRKYTCNSRRKSASASGLKKEKKNKKASTGYIVCMHSA